MQLKSLIISMLVVLLMAVAPAWADSVNINSASVRELQQVDGIGVKTAEKIVAYRNEHGPFKSVDELLKVKGFGKKKLEKAGDELTVEESEEKGHSDHE